MASHPIKNPEAIVASLNDDAADDEIELWLIGPEADSAQPSRADDATQSWSLEMLNVLRLGRRLVTEVPADPGRRGFVDITPVRDDRDRRAEHEGWQRSDPNRVFLLAHWDYDENQISGHFYDIGAVRVRTGTADGEAALAELITAWGLRPADFKYPWHTADPK